MPFFRDLFSTVCNKHWELARVLLGVLGIGYLVLQSFALYKGQSFDPQGFGLGSAGLLGAGGAGIMMKDSARARSVNANSNQAGAIDNVD